MMSLFNLFEVIKVNPYTGKPSSLRSKKTLNYLENLKREMEAFNKKSSQSNTSTLSANPLRQFGDSK